MPTARDRVRFGANYTPSQGWFHSWLDFRVDDARRDFEDLASIGLDHVRVFPLWPVIQPNRGLIRQRGIDDLTALIDAAAEFDLDVAVDLLQGHLSSHDFLPSWITTWHRASLFTDPAAREGIADYVASVSRAVAARPNVFAITLGNEVNNLWPSNPTTIEQSHQWAADLVDVVRANAPDVLALHSLYDDAWYSPDHPFSPVSATDLGDLTTVHSWVFNGVSAIDGPLGPATTSHAAYLVELADAMAPDPSRRVWLQEVGAPLPDVPVAAAAEFVERTVASVIDHPGLFGITWWCSHDVDRALLDFPEREYDLGLFTTDHQAKPVARALADCIAAQRESIEPSPERVAIVAPHDLRADLHRRGETAPGSQFHERWVNASSARSAAIVLPTHAHDTQHLAARSITRVADEPR